MTAITFQEYCEDILDQHTALMSIEERRQAYAGYRKMVAPKAKTERHPDAKLKLAELRAKVERFMVSQKVTIERNAGKDLSIATAFVEQAETALNGKAKKADFLALITLNSEASRHINGQMK
ncbi:hypothetical protein DJ031_06810 [bacterium endosymbiont of Escarpia laminata]|nr:MAG: hypothetical protein DJ031_06810 [bacterium endosymbiont of Escarpia laminata]